MTALEISKLGMTGKVPRIDCPPETIQSDGHRAEHEPPISRLPSEILCDIFARATSEAFQLQYFEFQPDEYNKSHFSFKKAYDGLQRIMSTCRRWRETAVNDATLWKFIAVGIKQEHAAKLFLERSKETCLSVALFTGASAVWPGEQKRLVIDRKYNLFHDVLLNRRRKIKTLAIREIDYLCDSGLLSYPADELEEFIFSCSLVYGYDGDEWDDHQDFRRRIRILPETLFCGQTPKLRSVRLDGVAMPWHSVLFRNLSSIWIECINSCRDGFLHVPRTEDLLQMFSCCPGLVSVTLRQAGPRIDVSSYAITPSRSRIVLPLLRDLSFKETSEEGILEVIQHLSCPALEKLDISHWGSPVEGLGGLFPADIRNIHSPDVVHITIKTDYSFEIKLLTERSISGGHACFFFSYSLWEDAVGHDEYDPLIYDRVTHLVPRSLRYLDLSMSCRKLVILIDEAYIPEESEYLESIFTEVPNISAACFDCLWSYNAKLLIRALLRPANDVSRFTMYKPVLPNLRELELAGVDLTYDRLEYLVAFLVLRRIRCIGVSRLRLAECRGITPDVVKDLLESNVGRLECVFNEKEASGLISEFNLRYR